MTKHVHRSSCKVPVIPVRVEWNLNLLNRFPKKKTEVPNFMNIRPVGADGRTDGRTDRQTDMTRLIVALHNSASEPETGF
jgi:hypothetical protein